MFYFNFGLDSFEAIALIVILVVIALERKRDEYRDNIAKNARDYINYQRQKIDQLLDMVDRCRCIQKDDKPDV